MVFCCVISLGFVILSVSPFVGGIIVEPLPKWLDSKLRFLKNSIELCFSYRTVSFFSQCRNVYSKKKNIYVPWCALCGGPPHIFGSQCMHSNEYCIKREKKPFTGPCLSLFCFFCHSSLLLSSSPPSLVETDLCFSYYFCLRVIDCWEQVLLLLEIEPRCEQNSQIRTLANK